MGSGTFVAPKTVEVTLTGGGTRTLRGEHVVVCTGSQRGSTIRPGLKDAVR